MERCYSKYLCYNLIKHFLPSIRHLECVLSKLVMKELPVKCLLMSNISSALLKPVTFSLYCREMKFPEGWPLSMYIVADLKKTQGLFWLSMLYIILLVTPYI